MVEITSEEQNKVKRMKRAEDSLRDLWDNVKCTNIHIIVVLEGEETEKGPDVDSFRAGSYSFISPKVPSREPHT